MRYEAPAIVRRERVDAVMQVIGSNFDSFSDVNLKANISPVVWPDGAVRVAYATPLIVGREQVTAPLIAVVRSRET